MAVGIPVWSGRKDMSIKVTTKQGVILLFPVFWNIDCSEMKY